MPCLSRTSSNSSLSSGDSKGSSDLGNSMISGSSNSPATSQGSPCAQETFKRARTSVEPAHTTKRGKRSLKEPSHVALAEYPTQHLLHLLAGLLQHIATSNDQMRAAHGPTTTDHAPLATASSTPFFAPMQSLSLMPHAEPSDAPALDHLPPLDTKVNDGRPAGPVLSASKAAYKSRNATLCFHARNVPGINIEQYLLRILKYCPTTNEVFVALLIYFDRMARYMPATRHPPSNIPSPALSHNQRAFCLDSFNVHRLIIAGVTVASKFFSDVFYTNSRYAKVGGLPLQELNQLELQFLLLNDFSLVVPLEEMQLYADRLLLPSMRQPSPSVPLSPIRPHRERQGSESTSGSSTVGGRSETASLASSTGTITGSDRMDVDGAVSADEE